MFAIERAHQQLGLGELVGDQFDDAIGILVVVDAHRDRTRGPRARRMQHIQAGAVAVVDLESEALGVMDHVHVVVDDGHIHIARQQRLTRHLAEATEADQQHAAGQAVGFFNAIERDFAIRHQLVVQQHEQRRQRHREHDDRGEVGVDLHVDHTGHRRGRKQHERELAALRHHHAAIQRLTMITPEDARDHVDADRLGQHQREHAGDDQRPVVGDHGEVQRHAHTEEEQTEQDAAERLDIRFDLVAESGFAEQHAREERAHRHRQATQLHQQRGAEHDQKRGRRHHFARLGGSKDAEQRIEQEAADQHQADDRTGGDTHGDPARALARIAVHRRHEGDHGQQWHDQQIFEQQDRDDLLAGGQRDVAALGEQLHHHRC